MPIYEYRCGDCGKSKDYLQKVNDAPIDTCPACGSKSYTKALTAAGFQLKGSGWYATDFKGSGSGPTKPADTAGSEGGSKTTDAPAKTDASAATESSTSSSSSACNPGCACH